MNDIKTKTAIVSGASRGIGRAICIEISYIRQDIANIVIVGRNADDLNATMELMNPEKNIIIKKTDLEYENNICELIAETHNNFQSIDVLINVAGYAEPASLLETTVENWEKTYRTNVTSVFLMIREAVKYMKNTGGKVINIASTAGITSRPGWVAYASSKAALVSISNTLAKELMGYKIKVYTVSPGRCATDLRRILAPEEDPSTIMQPEEVAKTVCLLLSPEGDILDEQNIILRKVVY